MIFEVKTFKLVCYLCGSEVINYGISMLSVRLPPGWTQVEIGPCGMTDYFRTEHCCPACADGDDDE